MDYSTTKTTTSLLEEKSQNNNNNKSLSVLKKTSYNVSNSNELSSSEKQYIMEGCASDIRTDGRNCLEYRPYTILQKKNGDEQLCYENDDVFVLTNGSSRVFLPGNRSTDVLCSIKAELVRPSPSHPKEGVIDLQIDTSAISSSSSREVEIKVGSILSHLLLPHILDKEALCILPKKLVWRLFIDILVISLDGNILDVCSHAIRSALYNTNLPNITPIVPTSSSQKANNHQQLKEEDILKDAVRQQRKRLSDEIMIDNDTIVTMPKGVTDCPIIVTVTLLLDHSKKKKNIFVLDTTKEEEQCASTQVSLAIDPNGNICGIHKHSGNGTLLRTHLNEILHVAIATSKQVYEMISPTHTNGWISTGKQQHFLLTGHFELI